jgi:hypothetical protein
VTNVLLGYISLTVSSRATHGWQLLLEMAYNEFDIGIVEMVMRKIVATTTRSLSIRVLDSHSP